jgi:hypothetical protein
MLAKFGRVIGLSLARNTLVEPGSPGNGTVLLGISSLTGSTGGSYDSIYNLINTPNRVPAVGDGSR